MIIPSPPKSQLDQSAISTLRNIESIFNGTAIGCQIDTAAIDSWIEKVIRVVEINRRSLKQTIESRFTDNDVVEVMMSLLIKRGWPESTNVGRSLFTQPDMRCINAALWVKDSAASLPSSGALPRICEELTRIVEDLPLALRSRGDEHWCEDLTVSPKYASPFNGKRQHKEPVSVVLLSPNFRSQNSIATLHLLAEQGVNVTDVIVRKLGSFSRLKEELKFSPFFLLKRVLNELLVPRLRKSNSDSANLSAYLQKIGCHDRTIPKLAGRLGNIRVHYFSNFNDQECIDFLGEIKPDYGVFTGGGIIKPPLLKQFREGIAHAHPGVLPQYKGMDVVQWAILEGNYDCVGSTCQIMSPELDAGVLFGCQYIDLATLSTLNQVRTAVVEGKVEFICTKLVELLEGKITTIPHPHGGKQYFLMHSKLTQLVSQILEENLHRQNS